MIFGCSKKHSLNFALLLYNVQLPFNDIKQLKIAMEFKKQVTSPPLSSTRASFALSALRSCLQIDNQVVDLGQFLYLKLLYRYELQTQVFSDAAKQTTVVVSQPANLPASSSKPNVQKNFPAEQPISHALPK